MGWWTADQQHLAASVNGPDLAAEGAVRIIAPMLSNRKVAGALLGMAALVIVCVYVVPMIYGFAIMSGWVGR